MGDAIIFKIGFINGVFYLYGKRASVDNNIVARVETNLFLTRASSIIIRRAFTMLPLADRGLPATRTLVRSREISSTRQLEKSRSPRTHRNYTVALTDERPETFGRKKTPLTMGTYSAPVNSADIYIYIRVRV